MEPEVKSLWAATADPAPIFPKVDRDLKADVAIIGGGYTGLSAAHYLSQAGQTPIVLEAASIGSGASGRNGGVVSTRFRVSLPDIAASHGRDVARRMYELGQEAVDCVEELASGFSIASCRFKRYGHLTAALNERAVAKLEKSVSWLKAEVGDTASRMLTREQVREETGSIAFVGGSLNAAAGGIHPLNLTRGLARGLASRGVRVFEHSAAITVRDESKGIVVETDGGCIRARNVVFATNAYTDMTRATGSLYRRLIPFRSDIIATAPLPPNVLSTILPTGRLCADTRRVLRWFRVFDSRLVFGGRGTFGRDDSEGSFRKLRNNMIGLFPALQDQPIEFRWSGLVAMSFDSLPHIGRIGQRAFYAMGYNGTGVAMANLMGKYLARMVRKEPIDVALLSGEQFHAVPFYPLRTPAVRVAAGWYQFLDSIGR